MKSNVRATQISKNYGSWTCGCWEIGHFVTPTSRAFPSRKSNYFREIMADICCPTLHLLMAWKESPKVSSIFGCCIFSLLACFYNFRKMAFGGAQKQLVDSCFARLLPQWWLTPLQRLNAQTWPIGGECWNLLTKFCQFWATNGRMAFTSHNRDSDFMILIPTTSTHIHQFVPFICLSNSLPFKDVHRMTFFCHFKKAVDDKFDGFTAFDLVKERCVAVCRIDKPKYVLESQDQRLSTQRCTWS